MIALLDGDIFCYRAAASAENDPAEVAVWRVDESIERCIDAVKADLVFIFLSDKKENNFRYSIYPQYKANRTQPKPKHLQLLQEHLVKNWDAKVAEKEEADDALGIAQVKLCNFYTDTPTNLASTICSIDKDLLQIPGLHYNFVKEEFQEVSPFEGIRHFYKQLLIGDRADNVFGVDGIGAVKAGKALDGLDTEDQLYATVRGFYNDDSRLLMNGQVLWIRQQPEQLWKPPIEEPVQD